MAPTCIGDLSARLRQGLERPLPGVAAQRLLAPRPRKGWKPGARPGNRRDAAVLALFFPGPNEPQLILTLRHGALPQHGGQVSLPGGAAEPDETLLETALRESREELGIESAAVEVLGSLTPLDIPSSGFLIQPFVGVMRTRPSLEPEAGEVQRILEVGLSELQDPTNLRVERWDLAEVPLLAIHGEQVWGATAMVLAELLWLTGYRPRPQF